MTRPVFLDVGAHDGQTLEEVTKPSYGFRVFAFEPMPGQYRTLVDRFGRDRHVTLLNYGLSDATGPRDVYGDNQAMEASVFREKRDVDPAHVTSCEFVQASEWFELVIAPGTELIVKLNCEGSEVAILDDLAASGQIWKVSEMMIDFDIAKVDGQEGEQERVVAMLDEIGFRRWSHTYDVMQGETHQERIRCWLDGYHARRAGQTGGLT